MSVRPPVGPSQVAGRRGSRASLVGRSKDLHKDHVGWSTLGYKDLRAGDGLKGRRPTGGSAPARHGRRSLMWRGQPGHGGRDQSRSASSGLLLLVQTVFLGDERLHDATMTSSVMDLAVAVTPRLNTAIHDRIQPGRLCKPRVTATPQIEYVWKRPVARGASKKLPRGHVRGWRGTAERADRPQTKAMRKWSQPGSNR